MVLCRLSEREEPYGPSVALEDGDETQLTIELGPSAVTLLSLGAVGDPEPETARSEGQLRVDSTRHDDSNGCADTEVEQALSGTVRSKSIMVDADMSGERGRLRAGGDPRESWPNMDDGLSLVRNGSPVELERMVQG
jgi:hypothetical protein